MQDMWKKNLRNINPYVPGEQPDFPDMIKLNTNENPYPPCPGVRRALQQVDADVLRLYPDPEARALKRELAKCHGIPENQIYTGVGSDDVLAIAFMTCFNSEKPILFPQITYSFYDVWAELFKIPYERPAMGEGFTIRKEDYYKENGGIVFANPNAPTGIYEDLDFVKDILEHNRDVVVIVNEAYIDFGGESACGLIEEYPNLLVVRTFSKSHSMAGMRIGYAMGSAELIAAMNAVCNSYNSYPLTRLSVILGVASVQDTAYFEDTLEKIKDTRERTKTALTELGFTFPDSRTNFIFATHERVPAVEIFERLREKHIFVRHFSDPEIDNYLRISVGTDAEMDILLSELKRIVE